MDFVDVVETIGNRLTEIDVTIARLAPKDPNALELTALRARLDEQQRALVKMAFDDNTSSFQQAAKDLAAVNKSIGDSIQSIGRIATAIDDVSRFLASVTNLVTTASKLA
jgi:chromosome segregation ATPase